MRIPRDRQTTRDRPCPSCGSNGWCFFLDVAGAAWWCGSVASPRAGRKGGWFHGATDSPPAVRAATASGGGDRPPSAPRPDFERLARRFARARTHDQIATLATQLGVAHRSLSRLGLGWADAKSLEALQTYCGGRGLWTFPMVNAARAVVGIRTRDETGKFKRSVTGTDGSGLFVPTSLPKSPSLLIACEGPTSCAALLTAGMSAVGRPNNRAGAANLAALVRRLAPDLVVVMGDNDLKGDGRYPGKEGADEIAAYLGRFHPRVRAVLPPGPPDGSEVKDARTWWAKSGARMRAEIWRAIEAAAPASAAERRRTA